MYSSQRRLPKPKKSFSYYSKEFDQDSQAQQPSSTKFIDKNNNKKQQYRERNNALTFWDNIDVRGNPNELKKLGVPTEKLYKLEIIEGIVTPIWYFNHDSKAVVEKLKYIKGTEEMALDLEWKPDYSSDNSNPIALMQFCGRNGAVIVKMKGMTPAPELKNFVLNNRFIMKGVYCDRIKLSRSFGEVEIEDLEVSRLTPHGITINFKKAFNEVTKKKAVAEFKDKKISRSNWAAPILNHMQFLYASFDAIATFAIYDCLLKQYPEDGPFIKYVPKIKNKKKKKIDENVTNLVDQKQPINNLRNLLTNLILEKFQDKTKCCLCDFNEMNKIVDHVWNTHPCLIPEFLINMKHDKIMQRLGQISSFLNNCNYENGMFVLKTTEHSPSSSFVDPFRSSNFNVEVNIKAMLLKYLIIQGRATLNEGEDEVSAAERIWSERGEESVELFHGELPILSEEVENMLLKLNIPDEWKINYNLGLHICPLCPLRFLTKGQAILHFIKKHCKAQYINMIEILKIHDKDRVIVPIEFEPIRNLIGIQKKSSEDILLIQMPENNL